MKRLLSLFLAVSVSAGVAFAQNPKAIFHTSDGDITVELYPDKAPNTVKNFIGLSTGKKAWTDPKTGAQVTNRPLYDGTIFHRIHPGFMIQGGDPLGNGMGGPGYKFDNEYSDLTFDKPGVLAMANAGVNTNGCQFFITVAPTQFLGNKYTIFGQVTAGMDVVNKIVNAPRTTGGMNGLPSEKPQNPVTIKHIEIIEPAAATANPATTATATATATTATTATK